MKKVELFTDGGCRGNPGIGGWGALLRTGSHEKELKGAEPLTTNNRMELMAAIQGLSALKETCAVTVTTDSIYLKSGITEWLPQWMTRGWKTAAKKPVKNIDLWQALAAQVARHQVTWKWVRAHDGHIENERADQLANNAMDEYLQEKRSK